METLVGRTAVVTGAGSGIGRALAVALAAEGMRVVAADIEGAAAEETARLCRERGPEALARQVDVAQREAVEGLADAAFAAFGAVHLLCNNAGVLKFGPLLEMTPADWQWIFSVNLFGVVNGIDAFVPRMQAQGSEAHIVNTASIAGLAAADQYPTGVYAASKYAVVGFSEVLRLELAASGIGVSVLCPSGVRTRIAEAERNRPAQFGGPVNTEDAEPVEMAPGVMEPEAVAALVIDAVRANRPYVVTHAASVRRVRRRFDAIMEAFSWAR